MTMTHKLIMNTPELDDILRRASVGNDATLRIARAELADLKRDRDVWREALGMMCNTIKSVLGEDALCRVQAAAGLVVACMDANDGEGNCP